MSIVLGINLCYILDNETIKIKLKNKYIYIHHGWILVIKNLSKEWYNDYLYIFRGISPFLVFVQPFSIIYV